MPSYNPKSIRPRRDWALVLMEERKDFLSDVGIFIAPNETGAEKVTEGTGYVIGLGPGEKKDQIGLADGDRVCMRSYLKYANVVPTEETWPSGRNKEYFLMALDDVLASVASGVDVGVYSRPAISSVESVDHEGTVRMRR
jgi:co-chaperonin GroES (HSP10)